MDYERLAFQVPTGTKPPGSPGGPASTVSIGFDKFDPVALPNTQLWVQATDGAAGVQPSKILVKTTQTWAAAGLTAVAVGPATSRAYAAGQTLPPSPAMLVAGSETTVLGSDLFLGTDGEFYFYASFDAAPLTAGAFQMTPVW